MGELRTQAWPVRVSLPLGQSVLIDDNYLCTSKSNFESTHTNIFFPWSSLSCKWLHHWSSYLARNHRVVFHTFLPLTFYSWSSWKLFLLYPQRISQIQSLFIASNSLFQPIIISCLDIAIVSQSSSSSNLIPRVHSPQYSQSDSFNEKSVSLHLLEILLVICLKSPVSLSKVCTLLDALWDWAPSQPLTSFLPLIPLLLLLQPHWLPCCSLNMPDRSPCGAFGPPVLCLQSSSSRQLMIYSLMSFIHHLITGYSLILKSLLLILLRTTMLL